MSRPPINPSKTAAGIIVDPQTLDRVVPESKRPDGSVRKEIKIRPGFTPQEDVKRFRGTRQAQMDANALPKGHIVGWVPPTASEGSNKPLSKSAKKNAKRKEKRDEKKAAIKDSWEDDDDEPAPVVKKSEESKEEDAPSATTNSEDQPSTEDALASDMNKLKVES
ncbi:rna binding protein [Moniliophthora roreri MCA 2997]|uniref:Rna binding protein n=2 Tax=Moniliophthora roreri TaxID=221103 RepID=V2XV66_MONRO|nr:rna binding protein [Moniliophthora roreri MCA 2997]KAI3612456.1 rna binding protein [Moniliophthora roreri]